MHTHYQQEQDGEGTEEGSRSRKPVVPLAQLPRSLRRRMYVRLLSIRQDVRQPNNALIP